MSKSPCRSADRQPAAIYGAAIGLAALLQLVSPGGAAAQVQLRNDMLLGNGPDGNLQIDRLVDFDRTGQPWAFGALPAGPGIALRRSYEPDAGAAGLAAIPPSAPLSARALRREEQSRGMSLGIGGFTQGPEQGPEEERLAFSFSTSLSQIMRQQADAQAANMGAAGIGPDDPMALGMRHRPVVPRPASPWDVWVEGRYARISDDRDNQDANGHFGVLHAGTDYAFSPWLLVGASVQYDSMHQRSQASAFEVDSQGWMAGPHATLRIGRNLFLQARAAAGKATNTANPLMASSDDFSSTRWLTAGTLHGRWQEGAWIFRPSASVGYIEDRAESYVDSTGVTIPGQTTTLGQAKFGPEVAYRFAWHSGAVLEPHAAIQGIWNFASSGDTAGFGGANNGPEGFRGRAEVGVKAMMVDGFVVYVTTSYDGIGATDYHAVAATAGIRVPLH